MAGKSNSKWPGLGEAIITAMAVMLAIALCFGYINQSRGK